MASQGHSGNEAHANPGPHESANPGHGNHGEKADSRKQAIFLVIVFAILGLLYLLIAYPGAFPVQLAAVLALLALLYLASRTKYLLKLNDYERAVIFRFGRISRVGGPGWALLAPPVENYELVDLRTKTIDIPPQRVVTKDSIEVTIDAVIYLKVKGDNDSVVKSVVEIDDWVKASELFVRGLLRDKAGTFTMNELISNVEQLNESLKKELGVLSNNWGITVEAAIIEDISIPKTVLDAMHEEKAAIQKKLARIEAAQGQQAEIEAVRAAAAQLDDRTLAYYYVKALEKLGEGQSTKIIFPMELTSLARSLSGKGSMSHEDLEELLKKYEPIVRSIAGSGKRQRRK